MQVVQTQGEFDDLACLSVDSFFLAGAYLETRLARRADRYSESSRSDEVIHVRSLSTHRHRHLADLSPQMVPIGLQNSYTLTVTC